MEVCYGNKYQLGEHILFYGDATNPEHLSILMGADKADLVFTDPPYDLSISATAKAFDLLTLYSKDEASIFMMHSIHAIVSLAEKHIFRGVFVWDTKMGLVINNVTPIRRVGFIGHWGGCKMKNLSDAFSDLIVSISKKIRGREKGFFHEKGQEVIIPFLTHYSDINCIVLDTFGGSGSTLEACERTGRKCRIMEIDPIRCEKIIDRWEGLVRTKVHLVDLPKGEEIDLAMLGGIDAS